MSRRVILVALLACHACAAGAAQLRVTSVPPGAEVFASPYDEPVMYKKGLSPCTIHLEDTRGPHVLLLRRAGHFDCYRQAAGETLRVVLASRGDPANWARLPHREDLPSPAEALPETERAGRYMATEAHWAPDASGAILAGAMETTELLATGNGPAGARARSRELWWAPLGGDARLLSRLTRMEGAPGYWERPWAVFLADPDWYLHTVPVGGGDRLLLERLSCGRQSILVEAPGQELGPAAASPDGRWVGVLSVPSLPSGEYHEDGDPAALMVVRWDGAQSRIVATDAGIGTSAGFSPDGRRLAYVDTGGRVCVVAVEGGPSRVAIEADGWAARSAPMWSPDGESLAAGCLDTCGPEGRSAGVDRVIWARLDGSANGWTPGVELRGWHDAESLEVAAPGYAEEPAAEYERVVRLGLDGSDRGTLFGPEWLPWAPALSPDGERIAVLAWRPQGPPAVAIIEVASAATRFVEPPAGCVLRRVGWQDEDTLWVEVAPEGEGRPGYALDLDSGAATPLDAVPEPTARQRIPPVRVSAEATLSLLVTEDGQERYREVLKLDRPRPTAPTLRCEGEGR